MHQADGLYQAAFGAPGDAEVVCVHGLGMSHRTFVPFARALAPRRRVIAVDLPGFGRSPRPRVAPDVRGLSLALAAWLRATGRTAPAFVANSMGCQVLAELADHSPELLGPSVLIGPTVEPGARTLSRQVLRLAANALSEPPRLLPHALRDYLACGPGYLLRTFGHALTHRIEARLPGFPAPVMVVRGTRDRFVSRAWAHECASLAPRGIAVEVPGSAHAAHYSAPRRLASLTLAFLEEPNERADTPVGRVREHRTGGH